MDTAKYDDFSKLDIRVGTILSAESFPEARNPSYKLKIDFGLQIGILNSSAQITDNYSPKDLVGKQVVAIVNFPAKQIANFMSQCLILGSTNDTKEVILLKPDSKVENGLRVL